MTNLVIVLSTDRLPCHSIFQAVEMQMGWITVSSSTMLTFRAVCVFSGFERKVVSVVLSVMTLGLLTAWMVGIQDVEVDWMPGAGPVWTKGACGVVNISPHYAIKYIVTVAFDLIVLLVTVFGVIKMSGGSRIGTILIQQGLVYFVLTLLINTLVTGLTLAQLNPMMSLIGAVPAATICVMCSTRLYVDLTKEATPQTVKSDSYHHHHHRHPYLETEENSRKSRGDSHQTLTVLGNEFKLSHLDNNNNKVLPFSYSRFGIETRSSLLSPSEEKKSHFSQDNLSLRTNGVNIIERSQTVISEPTPPLVLDGLPFYHPTSSHGSLSTNHPMPGLVTLNDVREHFPRLSKSS